MNCNIVLHKELMKEEYIECPFCNEIIGEFSVEKETCCYYQEIINENGMLVCNNCGIVQGYDYVKEYVDFYENKYKLKRKSIYHRKYHINNIILDIRQKYNIELSYQQKYKVYVIFMEIGKIIKEVNGERKRMISINFILCKILSMMNLQFENISISKSKKTLAFYNQYWDSIISLIGEKIKGIIN